MPRVAVRRTSPLSQAVALTVGGLIAGGVATVAKMKAEQTLQPVAEKVWPPTPAQKLKGGADPADHPENMPPTEIATEVQDRVAAIPGDEDSTTKMAAGLHWSMGIGSAIAYTLLSHRFPRVRAGGGVPAGLALYALTHASALPAAGLQPVPWKMPAAAVAWEAGSHAIYGAALDLCLRTFENYPSHS